jgi:hypothetical protein
LGDKIRFAISGRGPFRSHTPVACDGQNATRLDEFGDEFDPQRAVSELDPDCRHRDECRRVGELLEHTPCQWFEFSGGAWRARAMRLNFKHLGPLSTRCSDDSGWRRAFQDYS